MSPSELQLVLDVLSDPIEPKGGLLRPKIIIEIFFSLSELYKATMSPKRLVALAVNCCKQYAVRNLSAIVNIY